MSAKDRYQRIAQIVDEAYTDYEDGLAALRKRVVEDMGQKLKALDVLDHPREGSTPRSARARKR